MLMSSWWILGTRDDKDSSGLDFHFAYGTSGTVPDVPTSGYPDSAEPALDQYVPDSILSLASIAVPLLCLH